MTGHDSLRGKLAAAGLGQVAEKIAQLARPCYRLRRKVGLEQDMPVGGSRLGGSPDVPAGFVWPQVTNIRTPEDMEFVAQIRLSDLPAPLPEAVPQEGLLSFFTRWSEGRVFYFPEGTVLTRVAGPNAPVESAPSGLWQNFTAALRHRKDVRRTYRAASLVFEPTFSPADGSSSMIQQFALTDADSETYIELCETLWNDSSESHGLKHQMFGHASPVQNEMELECDFLRRGEIPRWDLPAADFIAASTHWVPLLQLDSDDGQSGPGWMWGDLGMVYFWIHRDDLAGRAFDRAIAIEQCH
jgi:uncharacterized protein YwqG